MIPSAIVFASAKFSSAVPPAFQRSRESGVAAGMIAAAEAAAAAAASAAAPTACATSASRSPATAVTTPSRGIAPIAMEEGELATCHFSVQTTGFGDDGVTQVNFAT